MGAVCLLATVGWRNQTDIGKLGFITSALTALSYVACGLLHTD